MANRQHEAQLPSSMRPSRSQMELLVLGRGRMKMASRRSSWLSVSDIQRPRKRRTEMTKRRIEVRRTTLSRSAVWFRDYRSVGNPSQTCPSCMQRLGDKLKYTYSWTKGSRVISMKRCSDAFRVLLDYSCSSFVRLLGQRRHFRSPQDRSVLV